MLNEVYQEVVKLLNEGLSLIPVRDKQEITPKGELRDPKTPYYGWKRYQNERMTAPALLKAMEGAKTEAVAIICGKVSGNLELIDIDSKFKPGIEAQLFADLNKFYPHIFESLRIHKTPSGGYHLLYKVEGGEVPGNQKLAGFVDEQGKQVNFLETRGEGGYALAPPSMDYEVYQYAAIPVISWNDRCSIINLCRSYTEIVKVEKKLKTVSQKEEFYSENPWEDFAASDRAPTVLTDNGWKLQGENASYIYYTRPGKTQGISASFDKEKRVYYFFTSSTSFEPSKGYFPGSVLALLEYGGNYRETYQRLVRDGYGKIKPANEKRLVENAAKKGFDLPGNISDEAKQEYTQLKTQLLEKHPYGMFWEYASDDKLQINRAKIYEVAHQLGFRQWMGQLVRIQGWQVHLVEDKAWFNTLKDYIQVEEEEEAYRVHNTYEAFLQKAGSFSINRMADLDESLLLKSTKTTSYKFYRNCYLEITADTLIRHEYRDMGEALVWAASIIPRDYAYVANVGQSLYFQFLHNAIGVSDHLYELLGFYAHDYKDETMGYIGVMVEQVANPEDGGGAGKNVFANLLKLTTSLRSMPGSQVDWSDKILSAWNMEKIFSISDAPRDTDFAFLKDLSTGEGSWKKLYKDPVTVPCHLMPKFLISTNFSYELSDGGLKRRIIPIEFTDYYTQRGGIDVVHGCHFPNGWEEAEYHAYDNIVVMAIQKFLQAGCKLKPQELTATGWEKQFKQAHGEMTWNFISDHWEEWVEKEAVPIAEFNAAYDSYLEENGVSARFKKSSTMMNRALADWAKHNHAGFIPSKVIKPRGEITTMKCKIFSRLPVAS